MKKNLPEFSLYGGEVTLSFDEKSHTYYNNGTKVASATQVLKVINKDALLQWAVNCGVKWLEKQWIPERVYNEEHIKHILNRSKYAWKNVSSAATDIGSEVHDWAEHYLLGEELPMPEPPEVLSGVQAFLAWEAEHDIEVLKTEEKVFSRKHNFSGTYDLRARIDGKHTILDFKTSKAIYPEYGVQLAAYLHAFEEEFPDNPVDQTMILQLPKDEKPYKEQTLSRTEAKKLFKVFKAALTIYNWQKK